MRTAKTQLRTLTALAIVTMFALDARGELVDYGPRIRGRGECFYDTKTKLYWFDPGRFRGKTRPEIDQFVKRKSNWNWATKEQIYRLNKQMTRRGLLLKYVIGSPQQLSSRADYWYGYYASSNPKSVAYLASDRTKVGGVGILAMPPASAQTGAWLNSKVAPTSATENGTGDSTAGSSGSSGNTDSSARGTLLGSSGNIQAQYQRDSGFVVIYSNGIRSTPRGRRNKIAMGYEVSVGRPFKKSFEINVYNQKRLQHGSAYLTFNARCDPTNGFRDYWIRVNKQSIGVLGFKQGAYGLWESQIVVIDAAILKKGKNEIEIRCNTYGDLSRFDKRKKFYLKSVICTYQTANTVEMTQAASRERANRRRENRRKILSNGRRGSTGR